MLAELRRSTAPREAHTARVSADELAVAVDALWHTDHRRTARLLWLSHREELFERVAAATEAHAASTDPDVRRALVNELEGSVGLETRAIDHLLTPLGREIRAEERRRFFHRTSNPGA